MQINIAKNSVDRMPIFFHMLLPTSCASKWYQWLRIWLSRNIRFAGVNVGMSARNRHFQTNYWCITICYSNAISAEEISKINGPPIKSPYNIQYTSYYKMHTLCVLNMLKPRHFDKLLTWIIPTMIHECYPSEMKARIRNYIFLWV